MDDAWLHTFGAAPVAMKEAPMQSRRRSLLEPTTIAGETVPGTTSPLPDLNEESHVAHELPEARLSRRAQSYSDLYELVTSRYPSGKAGLDPKEALPKHFEEGHADETNVSHTLAFDAEFAAVESTLLDESHAVYDTYHDQLLLSETHLANLLTSTHATLALLSSLSDSFRSVEVQTDAFRQQCESLVAEQKRLDTLADALEENARYYTYLEPMTRRLNAPGAGNLVKGKDFPDMLSNLDNCLAYMESHPNQKESATYRSRYRLLLTRALTLIRQHFTKSLADIAADISKRIQAGQLKDSTQSALLYAKFRVPAPELKALGVEIQKRAVPTPDDVDAGREPEYSSLLRELYESYSTTRGRLVLPLVSKKMAELASTPQQSDVLAFSKAALAFMRGICLDEYELWYEWFETDGALYEFLSSLMDPLGDYLQPRIIRETKLERLCELCAAIQGRYMDVDSDEDEDDDQSVSATDPVRDGRTHGRKLDFGSLVQPALQDVQTRLVFLAVNVLRDGIENYKAKPEDLDWPKRGAVITADGGKKGPVLSGKREPALLSPQATETPTSTGDDAEDGESLFEKRLGASSSAQHWYPTLVKAIWLLRRIYRLVNSTIFDDLAHRIVHSTIYSLISASHQVGNKKTVQDGQLFLITHLLHLKQQIVAFDIEFIPPEVEFDFSSLTNTFYELRHRGSLWNPASWVRLVGGAVGGALIPKVVENMLDAKAELDGQLRTVINDFVNGYSSHIMAPLDPSSIASAKTQGSFDALKAVRTVRGLVEKDVPAIRAKLLEFVDDMRTRETLVAAVRDQVVMSYEDFFDTVSEGTGKRLSRKGKGREDEVLGPELFGEAMERVFQVGQIIEEERGSEAGSVSG
ncbi:Sec34-like family-domain-containing protein [Neohortaea acidophila]|uniref:Conserved oligomeric Golgi complex subunit 3 n=1 Tax=Neohortaea acidophila TaxID=245834 RepID=A0A6A6PQ87_9PEZI|nr:Sec34-like family-domain-containing protein [Neohortaea acidophila]KAF2481794.1 Sec34-like family-domain-containing protein [Neohortaea acidophila]